MNLSLILFTIRILGFVLNRKNIILMLISIEINIILMLISIETILLAITFLILVSSLSFDDTLDKTYPIPCKKYFSLSRPSPHGFTSVGLHSGFSSKSISDLLSEKKSTAALYKENKEEYVSLYRDLKDARKAKLLENKVTDKTQNRGIEQMTETYPHFFDEDSGNTRMEGITQLEQYLKDELSVVSKNRKELKETLEQINKELDARKVAKETANTFFPFIALYSTGFFPIFLTMFSFCIYFKLIDLDYYLNFDLPNIVLPNIVLPTIITSTILLT